MATKKNNQPSNIKAKDKATTTKTHISLNVAPRELTGRKVKNLRRDGFLPANIFGNKIKSTAIQVNLEDFKKTFTLAGETNIVYLSLKGEKSERPVLISNLHLHPVTDLPLHVDFHQIDLTKKVTATVLIELIGTAPAEQNNGAVIVQIINEVDVEALPADLPDSLKLNISSLKEFGDNLTIKDIDLDPTKVKIDADSEQQVVQAQEPKAEEEPEPTPEPEETPAEGAGEQPQATTPESTPAATKSEEKPQ